MQCANTRRRNRKRFVQHVPLGRMFYKLLAVDMDTETGEVSRRKALKEPNEDRSSVKKNAPSFCVEGGASTTVSQRWTPVQRLPGELGPERRSPMSRRAPSLARNSAPDPQVSFVHPNRFSVLSEVEEESDDFETVETNPSFVTRKTTKQVKLPDPGIETQNLELDPVES